ncbi:MAG TPA: molecular chaperone DnaJ [Armatimonadetes bacterium]|nr:molecular chaperone DnaJ [Armatimonadota bacterium]
MGHYGWKQAHPHGAQGPSGFGGFEGFDFDFDWSGNLNDLLESLLRGRAGSRARPESSRWDSSPTRGQDVERELTLTLEDAYRGVTRTLTLDFDEPCPTCGGAGGRRQRCPLCRGSGLSRSGGFFNLGGVCSRCRGTGYLTANRCSTCRGQGQVRRTRRLEVKIPPGVRDGSRVRLAGEGTAGRNGGARGDLYIRIRLQPHPFFERRGDDLYCEVPITFVEAALGAEVEVPTLTGKGTMKVPPGTQSGQIFRLRGYGMPNPKSREKGDQYVTVKVTVPRHLSPRDREDIAALSRLYHRNPREDLWSPHR